MTGIICPHHSTPAGFGAGLDHPGTVSSQCHNALWWAQGCVQRGNSLLITSLHSLLTIVAAQPKHGAQGFAVLQNSVPEPEKHSTGQRASEQLSLQFSLLNSNVASCR
eukprot:1153699-Pelagomonas_calceolata.AAC.3